MELFFQITAICFMILLIGLLIAWFVMFILYFNNIKKQNNILNNICTELKRSNAHYNKNNSSNIDNYNGKSLKLDESSNNDIYDINVDESDTIDKNDIIDDDISEPIINEDKGITADDNLDNK